jgi:hypothetical protein
VLARRCTRRVEAIEQAKKPETRARRIEGAVEAIADHRGAARVAPGAREELRVPADACEASGVSAMTRYALLLRGVNVGTKNSLPMAELRARRSWRCSMTGERARPGVMLASQAVRREFQPVGKAGRR